MTLELSPFWGIIVGFILSIGVAWFWLHFFDGLGRILGIRWVVEKILNWFMKVDEGE